MNELINPLPPPCPFLPSGSLPPKGGGCGHQANVHDLHQQPIPARRDRALCGEDRQYDAWRPVRVLFRQLGVGGE